MRHQSEKPSNLSASLSQFHQEEDGMETVQIVMIIALAAFMLIAIKVFWGQITQWVGSVFNQMKGDEGVGGAKNWGG